MIARHWRGWTKIENADKYERLLTTKVLPQIAGISGHHGAYVLRTNQSEECEFVVINFFDSLDAIQRFAGRNYMVPVFEPEARKLLSRIEPVANHYEVRFDTTK